MQRKIEAQNNYIQSLDESKLSFIQSANEYICTIDLPKNFNYSDPENYITSIKKSFSNLCTSMEELGIKDPHKLTVFEFNNKVEYFESKFKKK